MNAKEIREFNFDKGAFGYKVEEVNACLQDISTYVKSLEERLLNMEEELNKLQQTNEKLANNEESVKDIIISAQKFSSTILGDAKLKAKNILEDAEQKSLAISAEATEKSEKMLADASEKSNKMIADALEKSQSISSTAKQNADKEAARLKELQKAVSDFKANLLSIYKSHLDLITKMPEVKQSLESEAKEIDSDKAVSKRQPGSLPIENAAPQQNDAASTDILKEAAPIENPVSETPKSSNFKITITENNSEKNQEPKAKAKPKKSSESFASKFGELKFGEHAGKK